MKNKIALWCVAASFAVMFAACMQQPKTAPKSQLKPEGGVDKNGVIAQTGVPGPVGGATSTSGRVVESLDVSGSGRAEERSLSFGGVAAGGGGSFGGGGGGAGRGAARGGGGGAGGRGAAAGGVAAGGDPLTPATPSGSGAGRGGRGRGGPPGAARPTAGLGVSDLASGRALSDASSFRPEIKPNTLTAGSFDDNQYWNEYTKFTNTLNAPSLPEDFRKQFTGKRAWITVVDGAGKPIPDAVVSVVDSDAVMKTRADGRALFFQKWDNLGASDWVSLDIKAPSMDGVSRHRAPLDTLVPVPVHIGDSYDGGRLPTKLDLAFVVDTTGSMGDELEYLKVEVKSIAAAIKEQFPSVAQRYSLIVYRDNPGATGRAEEYVTRKFDFTPSLEEFTKNLDEQRAAGGGDGPEAVQDGLGAATELGWTENDTARVAFWIADAPPHAADMKASLEAVNKLRAAGVAVYPVACSGTTPDCEWIMRTTAASTLSSYVFATNHSGVGGQHAEPHFPFYYVEKLAPMMKRYITAELSGKPIAPAADEILTTVERDKTVVAAPAAAAR